MALRAEDIMFWILIALIVGLSIWKLFGSPADTASLISLGLLISGSEILIWKYMFSIDKKATVSFLKLRNDMDKSQININNKISHVEEKLSSDIAQVHDKLDNKMNHIEDKLNNIQQIVKTKR